MSYPVYDRRPSIGPIQPHTPFGYDGRSLSRRASMSYSAGHGGYYDDGGMMYDEPAGYDDYVPPSYPGYATPRHSYAPGAAYDDMALPNYPYTPAPGMLVRTPSRPQSRLRRHSSSNSYYPRMPGADSFRRLSTRIIKFKRKGGFRTGVTLGEALHNARLSGSDTYTFHDLNTDARGKLYMRVSWTGYKSITYEIPVSGYGGYVDIQALGRRVARACIHFLQTNAMPINWDRVVLHHLEEVTIGTWQPIMTTS